MRLRGLNEKWRRHLHDFRNSFARWTVRPKWFFWLGIQSLTHQRLTRIFHARQSKKWRIMAQQMSAADSRCDISKFTTWKETGALCLQRHADSLHRLFHSSFCRALQRDILISCLKFKFHCTSNKEEQQHNCLNTLYIFYNWHFHKNLMCFLVFCLILDIAMTKFIFLCIYECEAQRCLTFDVATTKLILLYICECEAWRYLMFDIATTKLMFLYLWVW